MLADSKQKKECIVCNNPTYTWFEIMRDNCGKSPKETIDSLCKHHQGLFALQLMDERKK